jgi:hypothetical protein
VVCDEIDRPLVFPARSDRPWVICSVIRLPPWCFTARPTGPLVFPARSDRPGDLRKIQLLSWLQTNGCSAPISLQGVLEYKDTYCHAPDAYAAYCLVRPAQLLCLHAAAPDKPTYLLPCQSKPADRPTQISKQNPRLSHCLSKLVFCLVTNSIKSVALM